MWSNGQSSGGSDRREPECVPLVGPECRKRLKANELAHCEVDGLPPLDDCLDDVGGKESERQDAADLAIIDTNMACEARNRRMTIVVQLMQPAPGATDHIDKARIHFDRMLWDIADNEAGFHTTAANVKRQGKDWNTRRFR